MSRVADVDMQGGVERQDKLEAMRAGIAKMLPQLRAAARLLTVSRAEADDLVQEAVLRNAFREGWRRRRREQAHLDAQPREEAGQSGGQETATRMRDLARGLSALPPTLREALVLVGAQGLSYEEAAGICKVPVGTMKARVSRARRQLAVAIGAVTV